MKKSFVEKKPKKPKAVIKKISLQGPDFILEFKSGYYEEFPYLGTCDLFLPKIINKGKNNERVEFKIAPSGKLSSCLNQIIIFRIKNSNDRVFKSKGDEGLSLFLDRFKEEREKLFQSLNYSEEEWLNLLEFNNKKKSYNIVLKNE